ncbi:MAG: hydroxymethylbilane synthase [Fluviicola sp.]|nr:hydroxymethylbilane synthase [Fluviicola sp.]
MKKITIGSRGSDLALWQAHFVQSELQKLGCEVEINIIKTQGDKIQHLSFDKLEGKGFFTKEIEDALMNKSIDLAVHSHKDLETTPPESLMIACVSERANPADILLINKNAVNDSQKWGLKEGAIVGTSSARRKSQVLKFRSDVTINDLRGNVPTRINKLREGNYDAILLAKAGVDRLELDLSDFIEVVLDPQEFIPAPAQGVLGLQIRNSDTELFDILQKMNFPDVQKRIELERKVLNLLDGGCQLPLGVYCTENHELFVSFADGVENECISLRYQVSNFDGMAEKVIADLHQTKTVG